jgi:glycosyltransferase involved in cell wall biosynthesis
VQNSTEQNARYASVSGLHCTFLDLSATPLHDSSWLAVLEEFAPDVALVTGNRKPRFLNAARLVRRSGGITVWANDRVLRLPIRDAYQAMLGRCRQQWRDFDVAFVPGYAATRYARLIGFAQERIAAGLYTCDTDLYRPIGVQRHSGVDREPWPRVFLYVGQLIERKGVDVLLEAYCRYRQLVSDPWDLWCAGDGPLRPMLDGREGVKMMGFLDPPLCARTMREAGALIVPSRWDHWGVVVHEATCAGLPVLASRRCNASVELVEHGYNGFIFPVESSSRLAAALAMCSDPERARRLGRNSLRMSYRFDPKLFAWQVLENIPSLVGSDR